MGNIGFDINEEFIPSFDKFNNEANKRLMFLKFFNQEVDYETRFSKEELMLCKTETLFEIFTKKILKNLQYDAYVKTAIKSIDIEASKKINRFLEKIGQKEIKQSIKNSLEESNMQVALNLIDILEECNYSLYLDGEKIFKNFVSNKLIRNNSTKELYINEDSIDIKIGNGFSDTKLFTFWQLLDSKNLNIDEHIKKAVECINNTEIKQVYLVYPKNENFDRHIQIKSDEVSCEEYHIKLVPYSLRSTLR